MHAVKTPDNTGHHPETGSIFLLPLAWRKAGMGLLAQRPIAAVKGKWALLNFKWVDRANAGSTSRN